MNVRNKTTPVKKYTFTVGKDAAPQRIDKVIPQHLDAMSREKSRKAIQTGAVWVNKCRVQVLSKNIFPGDTVTVYRGREGWGKHYEADENNILYHDDWLILYRKEPSVPTQGIVCDNYNNLYAALSRYIKKRTPLPYLGMHHRLDMDTSGVVLFTLSKKINRSIHYQFKDRRIKKTYLALVRGTPGFDRVSLTTYINRHEGRYVCTKDGPGKTATTQFTRVADFEGYSLVRAQPATGRTHQIRLQLAFLDLPILGDRLYGTEDSHALPRTMLHAESLTVFHPLTKKELTIQADLFDDMKCFLPSGYP